jgi:hypothetical protein
MHELNQHLISWDQKLAEQENTIVKASIAEADYRHARAVFMMKLKSENPKLAESWAGIEADADEEVARLMRDRQGWAAVSEAVKSRLAWYRAKADALRSAVANDRAASQLYADSRGTT